MRVVIVNKSDARGGAAVVSRRLMAALRANGVDASMLVVEKLTDDPSVHLAAPSWRSRIPFLRERLDIYLRNGRDRADLFKVDTAVTGLPLSSHPLVRDADVVCLGWINQGMLSLREISRIAACKPLVWIMHDLWCATGVCHHPGYCDRFLSDCGPCPLLHGHPRPDDLSRRVQSRKRALYASSRITFVAVSHWLAGRCRESSLMRDADVRVIGNPFPLPSALPSRNDNGDQINMLMAAARLDDPVKGLPVLAEALRLLGASHPSLVSRMRLTAVGDIRDTAVLDDCPVPVELPGAVPQERMPGFYAGAQLLLSPSHFETLPGTLVEAQVYGALPVAFDSGGQRDIVEDGVTGVLADPARGERPRLYADAIVRAAGMLGNPGLRQSMRRSVEERFAADGIARRYIDLFDELTQARRRP